MTATGNNPLADWCRAIEARLDETRAENARLEEANRELQKQVDDLSAIVRGIQEAYIIGRMRAGGQMPDLQAISSGQKKSDTSSIRIPSEAGTGDPDRTVVEPEEGPDAQSPSASWAFPPED